MSTISPNYIPIGQVRPRTRVDLRGFIESITFIPDQETPAVQAVLYDDSGAIVLHWIGRRKIPGLILDGQVIARGLAILGDTGLQLTNPEYELVSDE